MLIPVIYLCTAMLIPVYSHGDTCYISVCGHVFSCVIRLCRWRLMEWRAVHRTSCVMSINLMHTSWWSGWMSGPHCISSLVSWSDVTATRHKISTLFTHLCSFSNTVYTELAFGMGQQGLVLGGALQGSAPSARLKRDCLQYLIIIFFFQQIWSVTSDECH